MRHRVAAGLTQVQLAERVGVTARTIQNWESQDPRRVLLPKWHHLVKLAAILECSVASFYERRDHQRDEAAA